MSEFLAEAQVLIRPNTTSFRAELQAQLNAAVASVVAPPVAVPVAVAAAAGGLAAATTATAALTAAQETATASTLGLASAAQVENSAFGRQAVLLPVVTAETQALAGAQAAVSRSSAGTTSALLGAGTATAKLDAGLLGLRTALGSTAVIGLGAAALAAIAFGKALRSSIDIARETEQNLNVFRVTADATATQMERVSRAARDLGRDVTLPGVSAADAAEAMTNLARAGLSVEDSIAGARGVLQLATAAMIDNATATELAASGLNAFGLAGDQAVRVADLLAGAANSAQGSIETVGIALQQSAAVARQVGFSLEQTVTALALLARNGLQGSDAGTSLRTALIRLINPTTAAQKLINQLGIEVRDLTGAVRPDVFDQFAQATRDLEPAVRDAALATIFGQDAIRAAAILAREGADGFNEMADAVTKEGQAAELAAARTRGLTGEFGALQSNAETAAGTIGSLLAPVLSSLVGGTNRIVGAFNTAAAAIQDFTSPIREAPKDLSELSGRLQEVERQIESFGDTPPPALIAQAKELRGQLQSELGPQFERTATDVRGYTISLEDAAARSKELATVSEFLGSALADAASRALLATKTIEDATARLPSAQQNLELTIAQARAGGQTGAELAALRERERRQEEFLDKILGRDRTAKNVELATKAARNLEETRNAIQSILDQQAADAEAGVRDAQKARDTADQALIDMIAGREAAIRVREIEAEATAGLKDDLRVQQALRTFFTRKIEQVRKTVQDARKAAQAVTALTADLVRAEAEIDRIEAELAEQRRERRRERRERQRESLSLDVQIAQATGNRQAEIRARNAEIDFLKEQIRQTRRNSLQRKRLILELRQAQKELRELQAERKKASDISKEIFFSFLQQQQGFAANLLGNLIPGFATAGLVGGGAPGAERAALPPQRALTEAAAVTQVQGRGITQGQGDTQLAILRQIRDALFTLTGRTAVPEARYQRATQSAFMDVIGT